ncbi:hypothetical protein KPZU09_75240 [Klebsiella pneumoniae]|uniref:DNA repair protein RecO n=1 Tax=Klebsiella pneumoniae TaxID=573 RepID=A0A919I2I7_KLEPN|nr:hypothetical protein KPZU09_75240 [Klebsiella pneumoniae]
MLVRFGGRGEVKTLRSAEAVSLALPLSGITLYSGLYVNELISRVLEHETRFSELFFDYLHCIQALAGASGSPEPALRRFELALLGHGLWRGFSPLRRERRAGRRHHDLPLS